MHEGSSGLGQLAAGGALVAGVAFGLRDALAPRDEQAAVVVDHAGDPPSPGRVTLFFHPTVPEATLVLVLT